MKKYFYGFAVALIMILAFGINEVQASATVYSEDIYYTDSNLSPMWKVDDDSVDALTDHNLTTQNFSRYGTSNIVFITQHYGATTYLIRCSLSSGILYAQDFATLSGYGHGESVEVTGYDASTQTYTVWVGATADNSSSYNWSTNIARLKYTVTGNTSVTPTAITITNLEGAIGQTDGSNRTAVSVAENDNRICFCTRLGSATGNWYYIVYSLSDLNNVLDTKQNGTSHTLSSLNLTIISTFSLTGSGLPNNSFQAIDNDGVGSGNKYLYISGGKVNEDGIIDQYLYTNGGNVSKKVTYIFHTTTIPTGLCDDIDFLRGAEIEGIKIYTVSGTDYMYIMFRKNATDKEARVYSYPIIYPTT